MHIRLWGTRGSIAVAGEETIRYGGNTTCVEIGLACGRTIIIDAGTGIRALGDRLCSRGTSVDVDLLITHIHWDHVLGFPFFAPIFDPGSTIRVDGSPKAAHGIRSIFETERNDGFFPVRFEELPAGITFADRMCRGAVEIGEARVESIGIQHPQGGLGFRITEGDGSVVFITDNELSFPGRKESHAFDYPRFCRDADLLIHDAQYTPEEHAKRQRWGHSDYRSVLRLAADAGVGKLLLTHHDYSHTDVMMDELMVRCRAEADAMGLKAEVDAARETEYEL